jgi:APA family basic amino acid/polyamine antiporter
VLEYLFGAATVAVGWSAYLNSFLEGQGVNIPDAWLSSPFEGTGGVFNLPAALGIFAVTTLLVIGIKESTTFNNIAVFMKVSVVLAFILAGWAYIDTANWTPYIPEQITDPQTGHSKYGVWGIVTGAAHIFFAYIGFDAVSTAAQETKNPQRNLPIGILASLFICTLLYIIVTMVLTGIVPYTELGVKEPIALGIDRAGITWLSPLIKIGAIAGLSSVMLVMLMAQPRIFMNMSKDGMLPAIFGRIHPKFKTPAFTTILVGLVCATAAGFFPINELAEMVNIGTLLAFVIVCVGIILLRRSHPDIPRPFKVPLVPLVPILGALCCVGLMLGLSWKTWLALAIWQGIGLVIYFTYGQKHKRAGTN